MAKMIRPPRCHQDEPGVMLDNEHYAATSLAAMTGPVEAPLLVNPNPERHNSPINTLDSSYTIDVNAERSWRVKMSDWGQ
jgi:hypothetical protein